MKTFTYNSTWKIESFPEGTEVIGIDNYFNLTSLPPIPKGVKKFVINNCAKIESIGPFPEGIKAIGIGHCPNLTALPPIPEGVKKFEIRNCAKIESIESFPEGIEEIIIYGCSNLTSLPPIPKGVKKFEIRNCAKIESIKPLPEGIEEIIIGGCSNLTSLPPISKGVKIFEISDCAKIESIESFAEGIETIVISNCPNLTALPPIPEGVKEFEISDCDIESIGPFPEGIETISIYGCSKIKDLPPIPDSTRLINLIGCSSLQKTPELFNRLSELQDQQCDVRFPEHWEFNPEIDRLRDDLSEIVKTYNNSHPNLPRSTYLQLLFSRFITEGIPGERGTVADIVTEADPVLKILKQNPNNVEWMEEIAKVFVENCVNQPVAGWAEIAALAAIAQKESTVDKINAASQIMALQALTQFIIGLKLGKDTEAEHSNVMFRKVHERLLEDGSIKEPWLGVPQKIRYAGSVSEKFIAEQIDNSYRVVKNALQKTVEEKANFLCENIYSEAWGQIAFPQKITKIKEKYSNKSAEMFGASEEDFKKLDTERGEEIAGTLSRLTMNALNPKEKVKETKTQPDLGKMPLRLREKIKREKIKEPWHGSYEEKYTLPGNVVALTRTAEGYYTPTDKLRPIKGGLPPRIR